MRKHLRAPPSWGPMQPRLDFDPDRRARLDERARRGFALAREAERRGHRRLASRAWRLALIAQSEAVEPRNLL